MVAMPLHPELVGLGFLFEFAGNDVVVVGGDAQFFPLAYSIAKLVGFLQIFRGTAGLPEVRVIQAKQGKGSCGSPDRARWRAC